MHCVVIFAPSLQHPENHLIHPGIHSRNGMSVFFCISRSIRGIDQLRNRRCGLCHQTCVSLSSPKRQNVLTGIRSTKKVIRLMFKYLNFGDLNTHRARLYLVPALQTGDASDGWNTTHSSSLPRESEREKSRNFKTLEDGCFQLIK